MFYRSILFIIISIYSTIILGGDVVVLNEDNFEDLVRNLLFYYLFCFLFYFIFQTKVTTGEKGPWMIKFYAPWCGHCKKLEPTWEEFATSVKGSVGVAKVDVTQNRALGTKFDIKGFPTVKFFNEGKVYDYRGARTTKDFKEFAEVGYTKTDGKRLQIYVNYIMIIKLYHFLSYIYKLIIFFF